MNYEKDYQICARCVMDTTDPDIVFDENGICNHCKSAVEKLKKISFESDQQRENTLNKIVTEIKRNGKRKKYDCVIGLSGGVDSSYLAYKVKELGLRPLAVHLDNGWNSELAVKNIENIVNKLNIDLHTHVIDWEVFKDLQLSFLNASVVDLEMLSDNAIISSVYHIMRKYKIPYFLIGSNLATESIMPNTWFYKPKFDSLNIKSIYKKYGKNLDLTTYPMLRLFDYIKYKYFNSGKIMALLDYIEYNKDEAKKLLQNKLGWRDYGGKHYESKITQFYQAYILPTKYNIDKRRAHLSSLICSGQITREKALNEIQYELYSPDNFKLDKEYFLKKLELSEDKFAQIMEMPINSHLNFSSYHSVHKRLKIIIKNLYHLIKINEN